MLVKLTINIICRKINEHVLYYIYLTIEYRIKYLAICIQQIVYKNTY